MGRTAGLVRSPEHEPDLLRLGDTWERRTARTRSCSCAFSADIAIMRKAGNREKYPQGAAHPQRLFGGVFRHVHCLTVQCGESIPVLCEAFAGMNPLPFRFRGKRIERRGGCQILNTCSDPDILFFLLAPLSYHEPILLERPDSFQEVIPMANAALFIITISLYTGLVHYLVGGHYIVKESEPTFMVGGILIFGYFLLKVLQAKVMKSLQGHVDQDRIITVRYFLDVGYFLVWGIVLVTFLGPGFKNLVLGGAILSAIAGIAAQGSLTNIFAGIILAMTHPFKVGEKISFLAWQYPRLASTYPHAMTSPEHTGTVISIGKIYTKIQSEDGRELLVPNNILLQAMVIREDGEPDKPVRLLVDLPTGTDLSTLKTGFDPLLSRENRIVAPVEFFVRSVSPQTLTVEIQSVWRGENPLEFNNLVFSALSPVALRNLPENP